MRPATLVASALADPSIRSFIGSGPVTLIAAGKAALGMTQGFLASAEILIRRGVAVGVEKTAALPEPLAWYEGGHPVPQPGSVEAGRVAIRCAAEVCPSECLVVLLSGGASALLAAPAEGVSLQEKVETTRILLGAGVPIHELNCVRKHLSAIKGGRLAAATSGKVLTLAISDVVSPVEDDPGVIGSGPTVGDKTTFADALAIVDSAAIRDQIPKRVRTLLRRGREGLVSGIVSDGESLSGRKMYHVVGSRREAMTGALLAARKLGYAATVIKYPIEGEARVAGRKHVARVLAAGQELVGSRCVISSGETTVTVSGSGRGGRNQELALGALSGLHKFGADTVLVSVGTDGVDGPTDAAGALVDSTTISRATALGIPSAESHLSDNNSYEYLDRLGDLIRTGPTGTNVGDLQVVLTR
ncbi:MAG: glycerate kinase [Acidobacteria bacterium]|nr:glycerate kinase [Acidobacteriota bacterium]